MKELGSLLPLCGHCSEFSSVTDAFSDLAVISKGKGSSGVDALYSMMLSEKTSTCNQSGGLVCPLAESILAIKDFS